MDTALAGIKRTAKDKFSIKSMSTITIGIVLLREALWMFWDGFPDLPCSPQSTSLFLKAEKQIR